MIAQGPGGIKGISFGDLKKVHWRFLERLTNLEHKAEVRLVQLFSLEEELVKESITRIRLKLAIHSKHCFKFLTCSHAIWLFRFFKSTIVFVVFDTDSIVCNVTVRYCWMISKLHFFF